MSDPARLAADAETAVIPAGSGERFAGYGAMGLPFASSGVDLVWTANLAATGVARVLNAVGRAMANRTWRARSVLGDDDFGPTGPLSEPTRLGDLWIPQRGIFAIGRTFFLEGWAGQG